MCLLIESGRAREAAKLWTLEDLRQLRDPGDISLAWGLLASIALAGGNLDKAGQIYLDNLADLRMRSDTAFAPALATTLNNLGTLSLRRKRWAQAEQWLNQAMEVWSVTVGHEHPCRAKTLSNLGYAQMKQQFREALSLSPAQSRIAEALRDNLSEFLAAAPARVRTAVIQASTATASTPTESAPPPSADSPLRER